MCGRYKLSRRKQIVAEHFDAVPDSVSDRDSVSDQDQWEPRYNIAPTQPVAVVRKGPDSLCKLSLLRWGLIPSWSTDPARGFKSINARSETVATTPSFRDALRSRRCLIPADGFYEWQRNSWQKQPYCFEVGESELFAFAGLWDRWIDPQGRPVETCVILTTQASSTLSDVHDRMPVILESHEYRSWLADSTEPVELLKPYRGNIRRYPVGTRINFVQNDDPQCCEPVVLEQSPQGRLFA